MLPVAGGYRPAAHPHALLLGDGDLQSSELEIVRVHATAILPRAVGRLDDNKMRVIGQRLVEHLDIDLEPLLARLVDERLEILTRPDQP